MTTPSISTNIHSTPNSDQPYDSDCEGNIYPYIQEFNTRWFIEERPVSASSPKDASGWRNPTNWSHYKFNSIVVPDGYHDVTDYTACGPGFSKTYRRVQGINGSSEISQTIALAIAGDPSLQEQAAVKAFLKLKNQDVNLAVAFAERRETAELFESTVKRIAHQVRNFKSKKPKSFAKAAAVEGTSRWRETPNDWLELQYGWKPLMSDVSGSCSAISKRETNSKAFLAHCTGKAHRSVETHYDLNYGSGMKQVLTTKVDMDVTVRLHYEMSVPFLVPFVQLGLTNPAELIWERLGYSFVVDWFLPVGNWLSALDADLGWNYLIGSTTLFSRVKSNARNYDGDQDPSSFYSNHYRDCKVDGFSMRRVVMAEPPGIGVPHFKNPLSGVHVANALSLLAGAFRRK